MVYIQAMNDTNPSAESDRPAPVLGSGPDTLSSSGVQEDGVEFAAPATIPSDPASRAIRWATDNAEAITDYNRRIRERGVFSDGLRTW